VNLDDYLRWTAAVPLPTSEQTIAFTRHVATAHSWYKHLSLLHGGDFVIFLAPDAGDGFPPEHPRMHHTWTTTAQYRTRFGHLDYLWRTTPHAPFSRDVEMRIGGLPVVGPTWDAGRDLTLPPELLELAAFILYPYAIYDLDPHEWDSFHEDSLLALSEGAPHPRRSQLLEWQRLTRELASAESELPDHAYAEAHDRVFGDAQDRPSSTDPRIDRCVSTSRAIHRLRHELEREERSKVDAATTRLVQWLADMRSASPR